MRMKDEERTLRTCRGHAAGRVGVALTDRLAAHGYLLRDEQLSLTPRGAEWFLALDLPVAGRRGAQTRLCLDGSERRPHLGGSAGRALCAYLVDNGLWTPGPGRSLVMGPGYPAWLGEEIRLALVGVS
jgi:hypothetical protein